MKRRHLWILALTTVALCIFLPVLVQDPYHSDFAHGIGGDGGPAAPSARHWLGTDRLFRDHLARLVYGARHSLLVGLAAGALATVLGTLVGLGAGLFGERTLVRGVRFDDLVVFTLDVIQSFPFLLLVLAATAVFHRVTSAVVIGVLAVTSWLAVARVVRSKTLQLQKMEFVQAARALGRGTFGVALRHILPNLTDLLLASMALLASQSIVAESVLGYLGLGTSPDTPNWGHMIADAQEVALYAPWLFAAPSLLLLLTALTLQLSSLVLVERSR